MRTKDHAEIDLIIERPSMKKAAIEIKSTAHFGEFDSQTLAYAKLVNDLGNAEGYVFSQDPLERKVEGIWCLPWYKGLAEIGLRPYSGVHQYDDIGAQIPVRFPRDD